jgi:hypothetical protein
MVIAVGFIIKAPAVRKIIIVQHTRGQYDTMRRIEGFVSRRTVFVQEKLPCSRSKMNSFHNKGLAVLYMTAF